VYGGTSYGTYIQSKVDGSWHISISGLTDPNVTSIISRGGDMLFVSCAHSGIFRAVNVTGGVTSSIIANNILSIYPNPVTSSAAVSYSLPSHQYIKLELIDQLGRIVRSLRSESEDAGLETIPLSIGDLPAGMYYIRLQSDYGTETQKVVVTK
jgi:hypothetical protein